ncbi:MAG: efflux RND transporter permease subunit [Cytophagaceae bacterium]|nr:efflux RND transporter permease subunit [Cytophagaceae bacterium]
MKEFKISSWSIDNRTTIYVFTAVLMLVGLVIYKKLPKEQFPEVAFPQLIVSTIYPGTSPTDVENLVSKHLEKQMKSIEGVKKVTSNSVQGYSSVIVEFNTDVKMKDARQRVKDAVDNAKKDLPKDLLEDPQVIELDASQFPIMNINLSGPYDLKLIKQYADELQDKIEAMKEIRRVDMAGDEKREIQINVDKLRMEEANVTMGDIERAVAYENMTISGGEIRMNELKRSIQVNGEFKRVTQIGDLIIRTNSGGQVYLRDIASIVDTIKEKESFARLNGDNVITLNVVKRGGENLIAASDKINALIEEYRKDKFPKDLKVTITGDQSNNTRVTLHDLINTIIIGFILVTVILMFFMGATNAMFVGLSVPLSMCIAFFVMDGIDFSLNMIVLFAFLLALGIVVDDAIVVIENTHRIFGNGKLPIKEAAKQACGEVFLPVFSGTMTTLAPFIPLAFWDGVIGEFMFFLPVTLIVTLLASLLVAYIINPVFAVDFMSEHEGAHGPKMTKGFIRFSIIAVVIVVLGYLMGFGWGNFFLTLYLLVLAHRFFLDGVIQKFQEKLWPGVVSWYVGILKGALAHKFLVVGGTFVLFVFSIVLFGIRTPNVVFFPSSDPNFIYTFIQLPIGTDQEYTDSITTIVENRIMKVVGEGDGKDNPIVSSVIANVGAGAGDPNQFDFTSSPHKGRVTVAFVEFAKRNGESTKEYLNKIREAVKGIPGAQITVEQEQGGPPTGKPVNIEITGDNFEEMITTSENLIQFLNNSGVEGVEELKSDLVKNKPEVTFTINRDKANSEGISTAQIAMEIRNAVFGKEISKYRENNDEYPIQLRYQFEQRNDIEALNNLKITYRDMNMQGMLRQVPVSSLANFEITQTYGGINRKNQKRMITISSNVLGGFNANNVVGDLKSAMTGFNTPTGITIKFTGEQEEQAETGAFLGGAMLTSIGLIIAILILQFNSISRTLIILLQIVFSVIGVLLGFAIFKMDMSIIMTGIGIVALAGIAVRNGILLVEFADIKLHEGATYYDAIVEAGRTRMTPVILTATATILGLVPLAVGLNIDFVTLFTELNPHIFFGGDNVAFWGPLSWTMIFGLGFATFLTLILIPVLYLMSGNLKLRLTKKSVKVE